MTVVEQKENISRSHSRSRSSSPAVPLVAQCVATSTLRCRPVVNLSQRSFVGALLTSHEPAPASACPKAHPHILRDEHSGVLRDAVISATTREPSLNWMGAVIELSLITFTEALSALHWSRASEQFQLCSEVLNESSARRSIEAECNWFHNVLQVAVVALNCCLAASAQRTNRTEIAFAPPCDACSMFRDDRRKLLVQIARREEEISRLRREFGCGVTAATVSAPELTLRESTNGKRNSLISRLQARCFEEALAVSPMSSSPSRERAPSPQTPPPQPAPLLAAIARSSVSSTRTFSSTASSSILPLQSVLLRQATHEIRVLQSQRDALISMLEKRAPTQANAAEVDAHRHHH